MSDRITRHGDHWDVAHYTPRGWVWLIIPTTDHPTETELRAWLNV